MITEVIGAVIGSKLDQRDGDSGAKGALMGYFAPRIVSAALKIGVLAVVGYGVVKPLQSVMSDTDSTD